ncbi:MAG: M24/M37 family peptidase [Parcubacteria group bacterium GW2011_GWA2_40_14]|nr:MAG: M24/M37 family peptidase [Parcubacteria group bacterium GW2011_GWA2_40_14]
MNIIIPLVIGGILMATVPLVSSKIAINESTQEASRQQIANAEQKKVAEYKIQSGDTFTSILGSFQIPYDQALAILNSSKEAFDFTKIQTGKVIKLIFINEAFASVEYPLTSETVVIVVKEDDSFKATTKPIPYQIQNVTANGTITDSLFVAAQNAGIEDKVTMEIADIFSSDIDFATDIRDGDSFSVVYEKRSLDGKDAGAGKVLAAKFINNDEAYTAFRYNDKFYDAEGNSIARQFLKSPLNYARISSGYSYKRENPVTKKVTPHRAIDYAADTGTPVIATADGKVTTAGSKGGLGIIVELKHGGYLTQYAHLSSIAKGVKKGEDVVQGDVIGYVGSTGISTGPHLQYAMFEDGNPINPQTTNFPRGGSIPDSEKDSFAGVKNKLGDLLR